MTISEQKDLLMIMKRSTKPIKLTSSFLVTLSLESYGNVRFYIKYTFFTDMCLIPTKLLFYSTDFEDVFLRI